MKRKKTVSASDSYSRVVITIEAVTNGGLTRREVSQLVDGLADRAMTALSDTTHFHTNLSRIKVK